MLRTVILSLLVFVCFSSATLLRKSLSRRQSDQQYCQAIDGFECKCSPYRVTCTTDRQLPQSLKIVPQEREKYPSVEILVNGEHEQNVNEQTFEPVKQLFKPDADNLEFRVKFEKFTKLSLAASAFNRVFPDNTPETTRKHLAFEVYNQQVQPNDNVNLFANLNVDTLELYVLYPFRGTFQQLFSGAKINNLRLSGGDIRSNPSEHFTGNIGRLELAKQANQLTAQTFPIYPAHELIINAFYVSDYSGDNPPNYSNLGELRIHSLERVPANAFRNFPNLHTLSVTTDKEIDPHAFDGLHKLEKLTIKDATPSLALLNSLPNLKEFEVNIEKLSEGDQCKLVEKLANGQLVVQAVQSGRECTCASAYLDSASNRYACDAQNCDQSSCAAIRDNYDASARSFKAPPAIQRLDGSNAFRQRDPKLYSAPYQIPQQDLDKSQSSAQSQGNEQSDDNRQDQGSSDHQQHYHPDPNQPDSSTNTVSGGDENQGDDNEGRQDGEGNENRQEGDEHAHAHHSTAEPNQSTDVITGDVSDASPSTKRKLGWLPIIIIIAAVAGLLLIGLIILLVRRRRAAAGYNPAATSEHGGATTAKA